MTTQVCIHTDDAGVSYLKRRGEVGWDVLGIAQLAFESALVLASQLTVLQDVLPVPLVAHAPHFVVQHAVVREAPPAVSMVEY